MSAVWGSSASVGCDECHYYNASPTSAGNNGHFAPLTGDHSDHFASTVVTAIGCSECHVVPSDTGHISTADVGTDTGDMQDRALALQNEAAVTSTVLGAQGSSAGNARCDNTQCHDPSASDNVYDATWTVDTAACTLCHSNTNPGTGSHDGHLGGPSPAPASSQHRQVDEKTANFTFRAQNLPELKTAAKRCDFN